MLPRIPILLLLACSFAPFAHSEEPKQASSGDPLVKAEEIVRQREGTTIGSSVQTREVDYSGLSQNGNSKALESLEADLKAEEASTRSKHNGSPKQRMRAIVLAFGIEILATFIVLGIAFQISGFRVIFRQLIPLSLAVALTGTLLDTLLHAGPLHPVRLAAGFIILLVLLRQLTEVREWATAIKVAVIARIVSIVLIWLAMTGLTALFSI